MDVIIPYRFFSFIDSRLLRFILHLQDQYKQPMNPTHYSCKKIPTELLQYNSSWDLHPFLDQADPVSQSPDTIAKIGLINPPLVLADQKGTYQFLTGWRSFNCLKSYSSFSQSTLWCRVLPEQTPQISSLTHLYLNYSCIRPIYPIELARFITISKAKLDSNEELTKLLESIGVKPHKTYLERIEKLLFLEPPMQQAMMKGILSENIARELLRLPARDRRDIFRLFTDLALGAGKQRRLLSLLRDLTGRSGIAYSTLLANPEIVRIFHHPEMNIPQKSQALFSDLQDRLTPALNTTSASFKRWENQLELPDNQSVEHSPNFEKDEIMLSIRFKNMEELEMSLPITQLLGKRGG